MAINKSDFTYIRNLVYQRSGIVLEENKMYLAESRLLTLAHKEGYKKIDDLLRQMHGVGKNGVENKIVDAMTTNETSFFRDLYPFEALKKKIIPEFLETRKSLRILNIWCAACSTGQEPYSIAMLLCEEFPLLRNWRVNILCTDISQEVLQRARSGRFRQIEINRGLPAKYLIKYFTKKGLEWEIKAELKKMTNFREFNLIANWPSLTQMDIVFLRNVLIYFDVNTKRNILGKLKKVLKPDGYLFLGSAETTLNLDSSYERVQNQRAVYYKLADNKGAQNAVYGRRNF